MSKFTSLIRRAPKRFSALAVIIAAAVIIPAAAFAWGPDRTTFTIDNPAGYVTFNSITDNPAQGDERNFVQVKEASAADSTYSDSTTLTPGKTYTMFVYYHNDAASNLNESGKGIAKGAYVKAELPAVVAKGSTGTKAVGYIGASNATPKQVWDDVSFGNASAGDVALHYVPGSATIHNKGKLNGSKLSDNIITTGAPIGFDTPGVIPGCNEYSGYITFNFVADQPNFEFSKQVRVAGTTDWKESVKATPGTTVDYQLTYKNTGSTRQNDVVLKDALPAGLDYVDNSSYLKNVANPTPKLLTNDLTKSAGVNIGNYDPNSVAYVKFSAKVTSNYEKACTTTTLHNVATAYTNNGSKDDSADVIVPGKDCTPPPAKITVCELATKKIVSIDEKDFNTTKYSKDLNDCKEKPPVTITVCELATKKIVTINEKDFDASKHSKNLDDCKTPEKINVCELSTKQIVSIDEKDFDSAKYSKNLDDCKTTPPATIVVCDLNSKQTVTINESDFDASKYSKDLNACKETPTTPPELPHTGMSENIVAIVGLGALIASIAYYAASRRALNQ